MRVAFRVGLVCLAFVLAGDSHRFRRIWGLSDGNHSYLERPNPPPDVDFACELSEDPEGLHVDYSIRNRSSRNVWILNRPPAISPARRDTASASLIQFDGRTLRIDVGSAGMSCGEHLLKHYCPERTVVRPGTTVSERIELPEPVREMDDISEYFVADRSVTTSVFSHVFEHFWLDQLMPSVRPIVEPIFPASTTEILFVVEVEQKPEPQTCPGWFPDWPLEGGWVNEPDRYGFSQRFELRRPVRVLAYDVAGYEWVR